MYAAGVATCRGASTSPLTSSKVGGCSTPKRLLSTSARSDARLLGQPRTRARHRVEALPPPRDFRCVLHAHPRMTARPRALDPLFTGRASWPTHRSPTSAIGRSASTHLRTSTPGDRARAARLTPRHPETATGAPDSRLRTPLPASMTEPARSALLEFRGSRTTRAVHCASPPRWLAGGASPRPDSARTPSVARTALATTETSLLATDTPARRQTNSSTCPDNGRAASRAHSRKRARSAAPKVPSTPKTPARGAVRFEDDRAF